MYAIIVINIIDIQQSSCGGTGTHGEPLLKTEIHIKTSVVVFE